MTEAKRIPRLSAEIKRLGLTVLLLSATLGVLSSGPALWAQESDGYQVHVLRHAQADQVGQALAPLVPPGTEIKTDQRGNRVLVRGTVQARQIAQRAIQSLDAAPATVEASAGASGPQPVLKAYSAARGKAAALAAGLQEEYGRTAGVRIVTDERTSQVLVLAPPEIQAQIAGRLGAASGSEGPAASQSPRSAGMPVTEALAPAAYTQQVQLRHTTAASLESTLASVLGDRLVAVGVQGSGAAVYRLRLSDGGEVKLAVDRGTNLVSYTAPGPMATSFAQLLQALDTPTPAADQAMRLVPLRSTRAADARRTVDAIRVTNASRESASSADGAAASKAMPLAAKLFQPAKRPEDQVAAAAGEAPAKPVPGPAVAPRAPAAGDAARGEEGGGLIGPVQIEWLEGLDVVVIRGNARDVRQVTEIIQQIEELSVKTEPAIDVIQLLHAESSAVSTLLAQLYSQVFQPRQGAVSITPLIKPNALLVVGRKENVQRVQSLVKLLDVAVPPDSQFQVFRLKHASPANVQSMIDEFYADRGGGLAPVVRVTSDARSNSLVVHASPRDLAEVAAMITRIDVENSEAVNELRVFKLTNTVASDLAQTLSDAIQSQALGQGQTTARAGVTGAARTAATTAMTGAAANAANQRSSMLQFVTVDAEGQRRLSSGILTDVRITYDVRANTVLVAAPAKSMPLIEALVKQLDQPPAVRAEVKVFTVVNSDASALVTMLNEFFGLSTSGTTGGGYGGGGVGGYGGTQGPNYQTAAREGESSLVPLRFAADPRTNSIVASGTSSDLLVVQAMLLRLDAGDVRSRVSTVYRLRNAPANDVATAINNFLRTELQVTNVQTTGGSILSPFEQIERQVVVVAEPVSNSLIVAATPRYFEDIKKVVEDLDRRPPMVLIQCLIAEVDLTDEDEFGVELGLQDKLLFNRGITTGDPGFLFNTSTLGNDNSATALAGANRVGTQGLTNLGMGRVGARGFGGLVLQASSESVSVLIRALRSRQRVDILARPQVQTLDNQTAYIQVGQSVPQISGVSLTTYGQTNNVQYTNTGIIMGVTPRISPDGIVVMEIDASQSSVGAEADGIPISVSASGQIIRAPRINQTLAQTTVSATDGQTVVLGGLINRQSTKVHHEVPYLADVPVIGHMFRYDTKSTTKTELLIIMTPHVVRTEEDAEAVKRIEAARMHWCLADVIDMMGEESGLRTRKDDWPDTQTEVIYPDGDPRTQRGQALPAPMPRPVPAAPDAVPSPQPAPTPLPPSTPPSAKGASSPRSTPQSGTAGISTALSPQASAELRARWTAGSMQAGQLAAPAVEPTAYTAPGFGQAYPPAPNAPAYYEEPRPQPQ